MKVFVSGLVNLETTIKVKEFPIPYFPIDYPFFGIKTNVSGVGINVAKALQTLGDEVCLCSLIGADEEGARIQKYLNDNQMNKSILSATLKETPVTVALYDESGKREIYCDLKDAQYQTLEPDGIMSQLNDCEIAVLCNINFNRPLLKAAKNLGKIIATDIHVIHDENDEYNKEFMQAADILFLSDEQLPCDVSLFVHKITQKYSAEIIVVGMGEKGAFLYERKTGIGRCYPSAKLGRVVNTIGAGDALFSAFVHFYGKGYSAEKAINAAQIFAALKIRHNGAAAGFAEEKEIINKI